MAKTEEKSGLSTWTFLTNHAHVLLSLAKSSSMRVRDLAALVGITERAVHRILTELTDAGYIERSRDGRSNVYRVDISKPLKHPIESHRRIRDLIGLIHDKPSTHASVRSKTSTSTSASKKTEASRAPKTRKASKKV